MPFNFDISAKSSQPSERSCLLLSMNLPIPWPPSPSTRPTVLPRLLPLPTQTRPPSAQTRAAVCTLGTSRMRPPRGNSRTSSRASMCESRPASGGHKRAGREGEQAAATLWEFAVFCPLLFFQLIGHWLGRPLVRLSARRPLPC